MKSWFLRGLTAAVMLCASGMWALLEVDVTGGRFHPHTVKLLVHKVEAPRFSRQQAVLQKLDVMQRVVEADLQDSGVFVLASGSATQNAVSMLGKPDYDAWRRKQGDVRFVLAMQVRADEKGQCHITAKLYDLYRRQQKGHFAWTFSAAEIRHRAHRLADQIYKAATGQQGYFCTKLLYVEGVGKITRRTFRLGLMDVDGHGRRYLKRFNTLLKCPVLDASGKAVFYVRNPIRHRNQLFRLNVATGREEVLNLAGEVVSIGRLHGDARLPLIRCVGKIIAGQQRRSCSVGLLDWDGRMFRGLTSPSYAIHVSPTGHKHPGKLVFNANREGRPHLYSVPLQGGQVRRVTSFGPKRYYSPSFSAKSGRLAAIRCDSFGFNVCVMNANGSGERALKTFYWAETPTWAPSGNALFFTACVGKGRPDQLYRLDLNSLKIVKLTTPGDAVEPYCFDPKNTAFALKTGQGA